MPNQKSLLRQSCEIVNSFFTAVALTYFVEPEILSPFISFIFPSNIVLFVNWFFLIILIPIQVYLYSGFFGSMIDLVSNSRYVIRLSWFRNAAKKLWKIYLPFYLLPYLGHFLIYSNFPNYLIPLSFIKTYLSILTLPILAFWIIKMNYLDPLHLPTKKIRMNSIQALTLSGLFITHLSLFYFSFYVYPNSIEFNRVILFISHYFEFLILSYIAGLIFNQYPEISANNNPKKELIMINPTCGGIVTGLTSVLYRFYPPLFVVLKALTPKDYKITEFNRVLWQDRFYQSGKLVAITCYTSNCAEAYKIAKEFKKHGSKVLMGGPHVTYLAQEALQFCDSVVIGEVEGIWKKIVEDYENNQLQKTYSGGHLDEYQQVVHEQLLQSPPDEIVDFLETTRGCKFRCHFCSIPSLSGETVRTTAPLKILELIERVKKSYSYICFLDNNIYNDPVYAKTLFEAIKPLKIKWTSFSTIDIAKNDKILQLAKDSGCEMLSFGFEISGDSEEMKLRGKFGMAERYFEYAKKVKKMGIKIRANLIFGFESDTWRSLFKMWKFYFTLWPSISNLALLTPLPGTALYDEMVKTDRLTNLNWKHFSGVKLIYRHKHFKSPLLSWLFFPYINGIFFLTTSQLGLTFLILTGIISAFFIV